MANTRDMIGDKQTLDGLVSHTLTEFCDNRVITLKDDALNNQTQLTDVRLPNLKNISYRAFNNCTGLTEVDFPSVEYVEDNAFDGCSNLRTFKTGTKKVDFYNNVFYDCINLNSLIINSKEMSTLTYGGIGYSTAIANHNGAVYVPSDLVETYRNHEYWKKYFIFSIDEYPKDSYPEFNDYNNEPYINMWTEVINNNNYKEDYYLGMTLPINFGDNGIAQMKLVAIDKDIRADGDITKNNGKARMTWMCNRIISTTGINNSRTNIGGWEETTLRKNKLNNTIYNLLPTVIKNNIVEVSKTYYDYTTNTTKTSSDIIWIPSARELFGTSLNSYTVEDSGVDYTNIFTNNKSRIINGYTGYWLRTALNGGAGAFLYVYSDGNAYSSYANYYQGIIPCFCI